MKDDLAVEERVVRRVLGQREEYRAARALQEGEAVGQGEVAARSSASSVELMPSVSWSRSLAVS